MALVLVEIQDCRIKKQNSKMYYITFTEPYKFFRGGFLQGSNNIFFGLPQVLKSDSNNKGKSRLKLLTNFLTVKTMLSLFKFIPENVYLKIVCSQEALL